MKEGIVISSKSRAEYFKKRRTNQKQFNCALPRNLVEDFEKILLERNQTKTEWLEQKIIEEIREQKK